ncbi:MAG: GntR family transcriptional regulator [Clostridiales bacterium]|nr:GntR family transcriptional regulator [Clostridiales bacterium]
MFQIDLKSRKSIYEQVVDNIKELIMAGVLSKEEKLPSVRELSKILTVNPNTIQKAYRELERQGFIYTVAGLGTFVSAPDIAKISKERIAEIESEFKRLINELKFSGFTKDKIHTMIKNLLFERGELND